MEFSNDQFEVIVNIFERVNNKNASDFKIDNINSSGLEAIDVIELESIIIEGLDEDIYRDNKKSLAYWALGKRFNPKLILKFKEWLQREYDREDSNAVYQLLIALSNLDEAVFSPERNGASAYFEVDLNMSDAKQYLEKD